MGNSLQDQLLKAGLVSEQKAKQTQSKKRRSVPARSPIPASKRLLGSLPRSASAIASSIANAMRRPSARPRW